MINPRCKYCRRRAVMVVRKTINSTLSGGYEYPWPVCAWHAHYLDPEIDHGMPDEVRDRILNLKQMNYHSPAYKTARKELKDMLINMSTEVSGVNRRTSPCNRV
jgi:hypothetical protein